MSVELAYEIAGPDDGPVVLLSSSLGTTRALWDPQVDPLVAAGFRVVRFDTRGHGASPAPPGPYALADLGADALALLDRIGARSVAWAGVSLGGMIGMWVAAHGPQRIDRLVLCCTSAHLPPARRWQERAATVRAAGTVEVIADAVLGGWVTERFRRASPRDTAALRALLAGSPPEGYAACCDALAALDLRPLLGEIAARTLVIGGERDPATPPAEHAAALAAAIPGARLELVDGAHMANVECAGAVNDLILDHLGGSG